MITLNTYRTAGDFVHDSSLKGEQAAEGLPLPFVSLLEFVSEVYQVGSVDYVSHQFQKQITFYVYSQ